MAQGELNGHCSSVNGMNQNNRQADKIKPWAVVLMLVIWQALAMVLNQEILLASPTKVLQEILVIVRTGEFWGAIFFSFVRIVSGFLLGTFSAVVLAVFASKYAIIKDALAPFMLTIKSIPVASFVILVLVWFSSQNLAILISFLMVMPIMYTNVLEGIRNTDKNLLEMAKVFEIVRLKKIRYIYFFEVYPFFLSGVKIALGLCWKAGIAAEVIGIPERSIGENLFNAKIFLDTPSLFAWTVVIILISTGFEKCFLFFMRQLYTWMQKG